MESLNEAFASIHAALLSAYLVDEAGVESMCESLNSALVQQNNEQVSKYFCGLLALAWDITLLQLHIVLVAIFVSAASLGFMLKTTHLALFYFADYMWNEGFLNVLSVTWSVGSALLSVAFAIAGWILRCIYTILWWAPMPASLLEMELFSGSFVVDFWRVMIVANIVNYFLLGNGRRFLYTPYYHLLNLFYQCFDNQHGGKARESHLCVSRLCLMSGRARARAETLQEGYQSDMCTFCWGSFETTNDGKKTGSDGQPLRLLRCGHVFDEACWDAWTNTGSGYSGKCPVCQKNFWEPFF